MKHNVKVNKLSFSYNNNNILNEVNIDIKKGEFTGILGPNGCGKSTLLKNILRYLQPENGVIEIKDKRVSNMSYL